MRKEHGGRNLDAHRSGLVYSIADITKLVGLGRTFVYQEIKEGRLAVRKAGRRTLVLDADLKAWLSALPTKASI
ncbi:helix-turn-helix domain-containing protein [Bradyrhizobium japonicum]|uniref:helix-turn-helix domain-containing protein n=1 Tax=Bradyrhizobium japonicum TaxID=375 RepID=UPI002010B542|nr:helix-turn-helix domain-containing protein [Bradyrhizobium japonicum]UQD98209.1 helix-turn-helix domain-containing protein [Bradyrhizobium japonicum]